MAFTNTTKPTDTYTNTARINIGETWDTNTTSWDTETRSWDDMASTIDNTSLLETGALWGYRSRPWERANPWGTEGGIINTTKPA